MHQTLPTNGPHPRSCYSGSSTLLSSPSEHPVERLNRCVLHLTALNMDADLLSSLRQRTKTLYVVDRHRMNPLSTITGWSKWVSTNSKQLCGYIHRHTMCCRLLLSMGNPVCHRRTPSRSLWVHQLVPYPLLMDGCVVGWGEPLFSPRWLWGRCCIFAEISIWVVTASYLLRYIYKCGFIHSCAWHVRWGLLSASIDQGSSFELRIVDLSCFTCAHP